jgi:hypothetical protein
MGGGGGRWGVGGGYVACWREQAGVTRAHQGRGTGWGKTKRHKQTIQCACVRARILNMRNKYTSMRDRQLVVEGERKGEPRTRRERQARRKGVMHALLRR